jgi:hypothetical protein
MLPHNTQEDDNNFLATWSSILQLKTNYYSMKLISSIILFIAI